MSFIQFYYKCYKINDIPYPIEKCLKIVEKNSEEQGIYRCAGSRENVQILREKYQKFEDPDLDKEHVYVIASVIKYFIIQFNETLIPKHIQEEMKTVPIEKENLRILISKLPIENWIFLKRLLQHLYFVSKNSVNNLMTSKNLSIVFSSPLFLKRDLSPNEILIYMNRLTNITNEIIENSDYIFKDVMIKITEYQDIFFKFE